MKKLRASTKIFIGFAVITSVALVGYSWITDKLAMSAKFSPIEPRKVNIVGINTGAGYRIIVANQIAQLVQTQGDFGASESGDSGATSGSIKKRVPMKELLGTLQGDSKAFGEFVMIMNDMKENDLPPIRVVWTREKLESALKDDPKLTPQLERDLNMKLNGTPLPRLSFQSLENGIVIQYPVTVSVNLNGRQTTITGQVMEAYKPRMIKAVEADYADVANLDRSTQAGYYKQEADKTMASPGSREDIRRSIRNVISDQTARLKVEAPERVLRSAFVVLNDSFITDASYKEYATQDGKKAFNLVVDVSDEGRRRLWQFTNKHVGEQLLLVSDGIAIAAPRIQHPLADGEITITNMQDESLLKDLLDNLPQVKQRSAKS